MSGNNILKKRQRCTAWHAAFKAFFIALIITLLFFLSSCDQGLTNREPLPYRLGTNGVEINFLEQAPPDELYENSGFSINIMADNKGAFDVVEDEYAILSLSFDPLYININTELKSSDNVALNGSSVLFKGIQLYGKSMYHPTGTFTFLSFPNFKTASIIGQREKPTTQILASLCYPYVTVFSGIVCLDFSVAGTNLRKQICSQQDLLPAQGQGAPVAITKIEVENQPAGNEVVRPVFIIHIQNKGLGNVLSPSHNAADFERVCSFQDLNRQDFNTVEVTAMLSTSKQLECNPNPVKLFGGEGFTRCQVSEEDLVIGHQNYETALNINLSYVYLASVSKGIAIKRLNVYGGEISPSSSSCLPFEVETGSGCMIKCKYCAEHPTDGKCQPRSGQIAVTFQAGFDCQCSQDKCAKDLYKKGLCLMDDTFCPGGSYCCLPECSSSEIRITGKCYSKCSSGCSKASKDCACGSGTDDTSYKLVAKDNYCCTRNSQSYPDEASCTDACKTTTTTTS